MQKPQTAENQQDGHLTTAQVAALLRVSQDTVRRHAKRLGFGRKVFGRWTYDAEPVHELAGGAR